uniref:Uncharacterized protein n=1 Tax=Bionectria ochroleuca TaxID=29856 RepID=A0A8H7MZT8_BIOOC
MVGESGRSWSKWSAAQRRKLVVEQFDNVFGRAARDKGIAVPAPVNVIELEWIKEPWCRGAPSPVAMPGMLTSDSGKAMRTCMEASISLALRLQLCGRATWKAQYDQAPEVHKKLLTPWNDRSLEY